MIIEKFQEIFREIKAQQKVELIQTNFLFYETRNL
jgi:hypothetical protein